MLIIILWSLIGLINLVNGSVPILIRFVLFIACATIIMQQLALMGVIK